MLNWIDKYVGINYKLHERTMEVCDCYGLVWLIYKNEFNIELPIFDDLYDEKTSDEDVLKIFEGQRDSWIEKAIPKIGDLIYFRVSGLEKHVGVFIGNNKFLHNLRNGGSSTIADLKNVRWRNRIIGYYRYE